jgi:hypothetical protein
VCRNIAGFHVGSGPDYWRAERRRRPERQPLHAAGSPARHWCVRLATVHLGCHRTPSQTLYFLPVCSLVALGFFVVLFGMPLVGQTWTCCLLSVLHVQICYTTLRDCCQCRTSRFATPHFETVVSTARPDLQHHTSRLLSVPHVQICNTTQILHFIFYSSENNAFSLLPMTNNVSSLLPHDKQQRRRRYPIDNGPS